MTDTVKQGNITKEPEMTCPVGEPTCPVIDRVEALTTELESLSELIRTDNLTGLYNQRYLMETLALEMERTRRTGHFTGLIMLDLDHFKQVNDTWGHEAGNLVLINVATIVKKAVRKLDVPCRYGGEEFMVILPNTGLIQATYVAERIRGAIETSPVEVEGGVIHPTASFGVDIYTERENDSPQTFISRADEYLYQAKHQGRDRVCHVPPEAINHEDQITIDEKNALFGMFGGGE